MRSTAFTILLAIATTLACGLAGWRLATGDLSAILGVPPTPVGAKLYDNFKADDVHRIQITTKAASATFTKTSHGWSATHPWEDRMDPQAAMAIIGFTLGMRVEDAAPLDETPLDQTGLQNDETVTIRLEGENGKPVAKYRLGKRTPWWSTDSENTERNPTVYVQPTDKNRKSHVFACSGDILPLFRENLKFLRDHHPLFFHPALLSQIRLRSQHGELTLGRPSPQDPWRVTKPLELRTDPAAIKALIEGLGKLAAVQVTDRTNVTLPTAADNENTRQIAISSFGSNTETLLEIYPPEDPAARDALATVSDRPNTVFTLPLKPERDLISLADLPSTVNDLRDPMLTHLNLEALQSVSIQPATGPEVFLTRRQPKLWTTMIDGLNRQANDARLIELLTAITTERAAGFESDAATDFSPWGLDRPVLKITFIAQDAQELTLRFGFDKNGNLFANRLGTPTVVRIDRAFLTHVSIHAWQWRHARLWSLSKVDLEKIERTTASQPPLVLGYDFITENWTAEQNGNNLADEINPAKANYLLGALETLEVTRWLAADDADALAALAQPALTLAVEERKVDETGDATGHIRRVLHLAPAPGSNPAPFHYGRMDGERHPFMIDTATFDKLAVDLMSEK